MLVDIDCSRSQDDFILLSAHLRKENKKIFSISLLLGSWVFEEWLTGEKKKFLKL